jgi:hypothetical protein
MVLCTIVEERQSLSEANGLQTTKKIKNLKNGLKPTSLRRGKKPLRSERVTNHKKYGSSKYLSSLELFYA